MKSRVKNITNHPLISGSTIIFVGSVFGNAGNYIFNLAMGRLLPVSEYGILLSIISVIGVLSVFQSAITNIFAKFSAKFVASNDNSSLNALRITGLKTVLLVSFGFFILLLISTSFVKTFLHLDNFLYWLLSSIALSLSILCAFTVGILQGQLRFLFLSLINIAGVVSKLFIGIGLVTIGTGVSGGIAGFIGYYLITFLVALPFVFKKLKKANKLKEDIFLSDFKKYTLPFIIASVGITFLLNGDVILARHFLNPVMAGQFAALSLMGKAIFYITMPIYFVFFPLIAQKKERKENLLNTLALASFIIVGASVMLSMIYFLVPNLIVNVFFPGADYAATIPYLGVFSLYILVFSLCFLLNSFFLSSGKLGVWIIDLFSAFLFVILFSMFHEGFGQIITVLFANSFLLLILLCIYYSRNGRN